jgi:hypothetical protein
MRAFVLFACVVATSSSAAAAETFQQAVERGIDEYTMGEHRSAAKTLAAAIRLGGDNVALARAHKFLAATRLALGDRASATEAIVAALKLDATTSFDKGRFPVALVDLFREVKRGFVGKVVVKCDRDDATVKIVGQETGSCNRQYEVPAGAHKIEVSAGGKTERREVFVDRGATREVVVRFAPVVQPTVVTKPAVKEREKPVATASILQTPKPAQKSRWPKITGWSLVAAGAVAFVVAVANEINLSADYNSGNIPYTEVDALNRWQRASPWIFVSAAVSAGAGTLLLLLREGKTSQGK